MINIIHPADKKLALCLAIAATLAGCMVEPSHRTLTPDEERRLQKQEQDVNTLPEDQRDLGRRQAECNREILETKDQHTGDCLSNIFFSNTMSKCEQPEPPKDPPSMNENRKKTVDVIDRNLKDALDKAKQ